MLATRILFIENTSALDHIDSDDFYTIAHNIMVGHGFSVDKLPPYCLENVRTPAYPYFLTIIFTIFGDHLKLIFLVQGLLDIIVGCCIFRIVYGLWSPNRFIAGCFALVCYIFSMTQWRYTNELLAEGLLSPLLMLGIYFLWIASRSQKNRHMIISAFWLGLAVLCKPNLQILPIAVLFAFMLIPHLTWRKRLQLVSIFILVNLCVQAPWYLRNHTLYGGWFLSRTYDDNIARVSGVATLAEIQAESVQPWSPQWETLHGTLVEQAALKFGWSGQVTPSCAERDQHRQDVAAIAVKLIRNHPIEFLTGHIKPVLFALIPQEHFYWYEQITQESALPTTKTDGSFINRLLSRPPLLLAMWAAWLIGYAVVYVGAMTGLWIARRYPHYLIVIIALLLIGYFLPGPLVYSRFRAPVIPYVVILYSVGLASIFYRLSVYFSFKNSTMEKYNDD